MTAEDMLALPIDLSDIKGFLDPEEGAALQAAALEASKRGPALEIGSYCGKSAVYIGLACKKNNTLLFTVDHHRGSEENQPGWEYHDTELWDHEIEAMETLPFLRHTLFRADLEKTVVPVVGRSDVIGRFWQTPLGFLFIDGGHTREAALSDYRLWSPHILPGGVMAIHDVFPDPNDGGQAPFEIYQLALSSGQFEEVRAVKSLRILRRLF